MEWSDRDGDGGAAVIDTIAHSGSPAMLETAGVGSNLDVSFTEEGSIGRFDRLPARLDDRCQ